MWKIFKTLLKIAPCAIETTASVIEAIRAGDKGKASLLAREAAERQALYAIGRKRLDK